MQEKRSVQTFTDTVDLTDTWLQDTTQTLHYLHKILLTPKHYIQTDPWAGIPELTNKDGQYCADSCDTQAWSASTLLDFLEEVHEMAACK